MSDYWSKEQCLARMLELSSDVVFRELAFYLRNRSNIVGLSASLIQHYQHSDEPLSPEDIEKCLGDILQGAHDIMHIAEAMIDYEMIQQRKNSSED